MGSGRRDLADWRSSGSGDDCPGEMFLDFERTANHTLLSTKDMHKTTTSSLMTNWCSCVCVVRADPGELTAHAGRMPSQPARAPTGA
jgi:hypothetical protein